MGFAFCEDSHTGETKACSRYQQRNWLEMVTVRYDYGLVVGV